MADGSQFGKIAAYIEILAKDPRSTVFVPLAETYRQIGLLDEALNIATRGVQAQSSFSPGYTVLGRIQAQRGDLEAAGRAFEKALLLDAEDLTALKGLTKIRLQQGNRDQAKSLAQRIVRLQPEDAAAQKMLAALAVSPTSPKQPIELTAADEPKTAVAVPIENHSGDPISTATIAEIYIRQGFLTRALKVYRDLLQADPKNDEIRRKLVALKQRIDQEGVLKKGSESSGGVSAAPPAPPVSEAKPGPAASAAENEASRQLEVLTSWLDSISKRRGHVQ